MRVPQVKEGGLDAGLGHLRDIAKRGMVRHRRIMLRRAARQRLLIDVGERAC